MIGFEEYSPAKWQAEGLMTIHVAKRPVTVTRAKRKGTQSLATILRASMVGLGMCVTSLIVSDGVSAGAVATLQRTMQVSQTSGGEVPDGYWERMLARLQTSRVLTEDTSSGDPEPLA
jgi:hypothetical protein